MKKSKLKSRLTAAVLVIILCVSVPVYASAEGRMLVPGGDTVGIQLDTEGIIVSGLTSVKTEDGERAPAQDAGIKPGDIIVRIDRTPISSAGDLKEIMSSCCGETVAVRVKRGDEEYQFSLTPAKNTVGGYELGVWMRDSIAGIGTITFIDPQSGQFGALGHAITDIDTGVLMPARGGIISSSEITGIVRGEIGAPGELVGNFDSDNAIGSINENCESGIFGLINDKMMLADLSEMEAASANCVHPGSAVIRSNICKGNAEDYTVEIDKVYNQSSQGRSMLLRVTDERLLSLTGGIVQGMSGSPIIQDGRLIGAVTHVLVNDPTRGYGIFIEDMLSDAA